MSEYDTVGRVPSRVQARDEQCHDPARCDIHGHDVGSIGWKLREADNYANVGLWEQSIKELVGAVRLYIERVEVRMHTHGSAQGSDCTEPHLGLATTRDMLEEIKERAKARDTIYSGGTLRTVEYLLRLIPEGSSIDKATADQ